MERADLIIDLIKRRREGLSAEQTKTEAKAALAHISPDELRQIEHDLRKKGCHPWELQSLRDLQLATLHEDLKKLRQSVPPWHPIHTMITEHDEILHNLERLDGINASVRTKADFDQELIARLRKVALNLLAAEPHHAREEEVVFPELASRNIAGPVQAMNEDHVELRAGKHALLKLTDEARNLDFDVFKERLDTLAQFLVYNLGDHIYKENHILYPAAIRLIKDEKLWTELKARCDEIGYCNFTVSH